MDHPRHSSPQGGAFAFLKTLPFLTGAVATLIVNAGGQIVAKDAITAPAVSLSPTASGDMDSSVKPGDDFYRYANGGWLAKSVLPAVQTSYDTRAMLKEKASGQVRDLIQAAATAPSEKGGLAQKVGDYYASFMDEASIEAKGFTPLADEMATIAAINNKTSLSAYLGTTLNSEVDGLTANSDHVLGLWVNQGFEDSEHNLPHLWQGGLGLPDRDNYIDPSPQDVELRAKYQAHIAAVLKLAGFADSETRAAHILALETSMARAFAPDSDAADVFKQNNPWKRADFDAKAPGMDWESYFKSAGLARQPDFIVWQPSAVTGISALVEIDNLNQWKDYLRFHLVEHYASALPRAVSAEAQRAQNRAQAAVDATNGALPQAVGQLYAQLYFPPAAKARAEEMVGDLIKAFRARIANLTWLSPLSKEKALAKLAALEIGIGYPDKWIDYSSLDIVRDDAFGNVRRTEAFNRQRNLARLRQPVNPIDWPINPQIPGAVLMFSPNAEFFSAAILQPPYFDGRGDAASNYGSAGAGIAHEISHSFDELGNIYDAHGRLGTWWSDEDLLQFRAKSGKQAVQLDAYCPFTDLCVKGKQVLSESVADLAGLLVAHDAYVLSLKGKAEVMLGGLNGEQRFFLAFAQRWRKVQSEAALRRQIAGDTHLPGEYRSDAVRNVDAWYNAYNVVAGDKLFVPPEERIRIW